MTHAPIIRRRVNIDFAASKAGAWHRGSKEFEHVLNALSFVFPAGEKFFIESVRNYLDRIRDPALRDEANRFIYQEAMHTKEHIRSNLVLKQTYPHGEEIEKLAAFSLSIARRFTPRAVQLATTCALEHFTAMLSDDLLRKQEWFVSESDPAFSALWLWHAVEETEHKAVCFDVYQHVVGKGVFSYLLRIFTMFMTSLIFMAVLLIAFRKIVKHNRQAAPAGSATGTLRQQSTEAPRESYLLLDSSWQLYFDYYRS
jgi:predicted metal-dependent hydrolase